ncbi:hypothetical protein PBOI14_54000 [Pseudomonas sp. Boi14]|nr:hypothetical protein PBOI14_54000 [Pseudomonas sp. Boi14]
MHFGSQHQLTLESSASLEVLLASNRLLLDAAIPAIDYLSQHQGKDGMIILANADATILAIEGRADRLKDSGVQDITLGACWSEATRGTNALGTALVEARPTLIDCGEHYLDRLSHFSCTSVPIQCPQGEILGVLDLTREGPLGRAQDSTALLAMAVSQIEARVFHATYPEQIVLAFHSRRQYLESPWQGLLALSLGGQILAVSGQACQLLNTPRAALVGRRCEEFLGVDGLQLLARLQQGAVGSLQTAKGELFYKALRAPQPALNLHRAPRSAPKAAAMPQDLEALAGATAVTPAPCAWPVRAWPMTCRCCYWEKPAPARKSWPGPCTAPAAAPRNPLSRSTARRSRRPDRVGTVRLSRRCLHRLASWRHDRAPATGPRRHPVPR